MDRAELLSLVAGRIVARRMEGRPLKVAIDGRCGSGKSILADGLGTALTAKGMQVVRISVDEFHHPKEHRYRQGMDSAQGYYEDAFDYGAVVEKLLQLSVSLGTDAVLLFDGVFALRKELDPYWDLRILVDVDAPTAIARAVLRDTGSSPAENIKRKYEVRYEPAWLIYVGREAPEAKADIVIHNSEIAFPEVTLPPPPAVR